MNPNILIDTPPPQAPEAERSVLGAMLASRDARDYALVAVHPDWFYLPQHRLVFLHLLKLGTKGDLITVTQSLKDSGEINDAGGAGYLSGLVNCVTSVENAEYYAGILKDKHTLRVARTLGAELVSRSERQDAPDVVEFAAKIPAKLDETGGDDVDTGHIVEAIEGRRAVIAERGYSGLKTGFKELDSVLHEGLPLGGITAVVGETGAGKSMIALQVVDQIVQEHRCHALLVSLEMRKEDIWPRVVGSRLYRSMYAREPFNYTWLRNNPRILEEHPEWRKVENDVAGWHIDDRSRLTYYQIAAQIRRHHRAFDIKLAVVDHLGLIRIPKGESILEYHDTGANILREMAKDLDIAIVLLAHRDTQSSRMATRTPKAEQVRYFIVALQASVSAFMVDKERVIVTKARFGHEGPVDLKLNGAMATFEDTYHKGFTPWKEK